jgi:phosphoenolpyruvate-protein phosphotransferase/dihydroxyacetone kinase phosphotransfer subunit
MTVGLVIVSHSARLAAGIAELVSQLVQGKVPIAPAGGGIDGVLGTAADKIAEAIISVDNPDGVLLLLDLGSAILSTEMALEMLDEEQRRHVRMSFAPLVEGAVAAAVKASLGGSLAEVQQAAENAASPDQLRQLKPLSQETAASDTTYPSPPATSQLIAEKGSALRSSANTLEAQLPLTNAMGLHARPATRFVQTAAHFQSDIHVSVRGKQANAKGLFAVLSLGAKQGETITIQATGDDAAAAIAALSALVQAGFAETDSVGADLSRPSTTPDMEIANAVPSSQKIAEAGDTWHGIRASAGAAVAPAFLYASTSAALEMVERRAISPDRVPAEQERLRNALEAAAQDLRALEQEMQGKVGKAEAAIFEAQALMLRDDALIDFAANMIAEQHIDAVGALAATGQHYAATLAALDNPVLAARAADVRDVISRAIGKLNGQPASKPDLSALQQPVILLAHDLTPSDTAALAPDTIAGICTVQGGPTAHAAILARALGIPALAGLPADALLRIHPGDELGLDADNGLLYRFPAPETRAQLAQRQAERQQQRAVLAQAAAQSHTPVMIDGRHILLLANIGGAAEAAAARQWGAEGIGLLRTEFLFAGASTMPGEEEQRQQYAQVFRAFAGNAPARAGPIVVRTLDAGADKPMPALNAITGPFSEANPALGLRGIRLHLAHPELLEQQISALLLAATDTGIDLHIMFPMITTIEELHAARAIFDRVYARLRSQQIPLPKYVPVGIMVEVPSAAIMAPELAAVADFFSIGANDLLQYTVASDRTNAAVASLYHPMQPAALRLIAQVAQAGQRAGKPVAVCGEIGGDARLAPVLVGLGITELSMNPASIPAIRAALTGKSTQELSALSAHVTQAQTVAEVEQLCATFSPAT